MENIKHPDTSSLIWWNNLSLEKKWDYVNMWDSDFEFERGTLKILSNFEIEKIYQLINNHE